MVWFNSVPGVSSLRSSITHYWRDLLAVTILFFQFRIHLVTHSLRDPLAVGLHTKGISKRDLQYRGFRDDAILQRGMKRVSFSHDDREGWRLQTNI